MELYEKVYVISKEILGENHPDTLLVLSNLLVSQILQDETDNQSIKKSLNAYFENINNLKRTAFSIKEVSSRRHFLESFSNVIIRKEQHRQSHKVHHLYHQLHH